MECTIIQKDLWCIQQNYLAHLFVHVNIRVHKFIIGSLGGRGNDRISWCRSDEFSLFGKYIYQYLQLVLFWYLSTFKQRSRY